MRRLALPLAALAALAAAGCRRPPVEVTGQPAYEEVEKPPYINWTQPPTVVAIAGTGVSYPQECVQEELYQVGGKWYWFYKGHWFAAEALAGPWRATTDVPREFLKIPRDHPRHRIVRHHPEYKPQ